MPRASAEHATRMRQRILDGAHRAMLAGGYHGTTMPSIAAEAGVSVGLLYRYFDSKEELYLGMCDAVTQAQLDELAVQMGRISDPRERLAAAIRTYIGSLETERWGPIVTAGWAEAEVKPAVRALLRRRCDQVRAFAAMFLREAIAAGEVDASLEVEEFTLAATMLMDGVIAHQAEAGDRFDPAVVERSVIGLLGSILRR